MRNGGPAQEDFTNKIYEHTLNIREYVIADDFTADIDISKLQDYVFENVDRFGNYL